MGIQINGNTNNINAGIGSLSIEDLNELDIVGVATAANFKTGVSNLHNVGLTLSGGQIDVGSNIKIGTAGVVTATSFVGSGANLTSLPAANITGTLPAISGANLTNLDASDLASGTVPTARLGSGTASSSTFLRGDSTFAAVTSTTINSNSAQRVITGSGTANTLEAATEFLHDAANSDTKIEGYQALKVIDLIVKNTNNFGNAAGARITIESGSAANTGPQFQMICGSHDWSMQVPKAAGNLEFNNNGSPAFRMNNDNNFLINDGNLVIGTSGHGIDFSATTNYGTSTPAELLDDYEEGQFTPDWSINSGSFGRLTTRGEYCKVGRVVHCMFSISTNGSTNPSGTVTITGFPFSGEVPSANGPRGGGGVIYAGYGAPSTISRGYLNGTTLYLKLSDGSTVEASDFTNTGYNGGQLSGMITYLTTT